MTGKLFILKTCFVGLTLSSLNMDRNRMILKQLCSLVNEANWQQIEAKHFLAFGMFNTMHWIDHYLDHNQYPDLGI